MLADPERDVRVRIAADVELERALEDFFVAISRGIEQAHRLTGANLLPANLGVRACGPRELDDRGRPADDLLDRGIDQRRIAPELLPFVGILDKSLQPASSRVA